jgi:hypothetical protein
MGCFAMTRLEATTSDKIHRKFLNFVRPLRKNIQADVHTKGNRLTLQIGDKSRYFEMDRPLPAFDNFDFAVFALAAQSIRRGVCIRFDLPVSQSAANAAARIGSIWQARAPHFSSPLDLELTNIISDQPAASCNRILCISGGVDSTYSACIDTSFSHGLSIRGFDFPMSNRIGFEGRRHRMQIVADKFSLDLQELRTDLSLSFKSHYDAYNVLFMASCLGFAGYGMGGGAFSGDFSARGQLVATTFCSTEGIAPLLSTKQFPIDMVGSLPTRGEKIRAIYEIAPDLLPNLGFCLEEQASGGNCGRCDKCMRTRMCLDYSGLDQKLVFDDVADPVDFFRDCNPASAFMANLQLVHLDIAVDALPESAQRLEYMKIAEDMRRKHHGLRGSYLKS